MEAAQVRGARFPSRLDPLILFVVAGVIFASHGFQDRFGTDLGTFVYGGEHVADGVPPYRGIFNSVGPLADLLPGIAIRLGDLVGLDPILSARVGFLVVSALCVAALYLLAVDVFDSRAAGWIAATALLASGEFIQLASSGPREKTPMVLFVIGALLMIRRRRWFAAGALVALATLTWQPALLPGLTAAAVGIMLQSSERLRAGARFLVGGAVPSAVTLLYFWAESTLHLAWQGFVVINAGYTESSSLFDQSYPLLPTLRREYGPSLWLIPFGLLVLVAMGVAAAFPRRSDSPEPVRGLLSSSRDGILVAAVGGVVAAAWTVYAINGAPDLFVLLPFASLGLAGGCCFLVRFLSPHHGRMLLVGMTGLGVVGSLVFALATRSDLLPLERRDAQRVTAAAGPRATVLSVHAPEVLAILERDNLSRWQLFTSTMTGYLDQELPGGLAAYADRIEAAHPTLIAVGGRSDTTWLEPVLHRDYRRIGKGPGWTWYADRDLGPRGLDRVRAANTAVMG